MFDLVFLFAFKYFADGQKCIKMTLPIQDVNNVNSLNERLRLLSLVHPSYLALTMDALYLTQQLSDLFQFAH